MSLDTAQIDWSKFGDLMRGRRAEKRLSQTEVAKELGISQPAVSMIERGSPTGLSDDRLSTLLTLLGISESEVPTTAARTPEKGKKLFISYSHKDKEYLSRLLVHLRPLEKSKLIDAWNDTRIVPGQKWREEIEKALEAAAVAVLLVSADFLASNFIVDNELPPLLESASKQGTVILPVILTPCRFARDKNLSVFQAVNTPNTPLSGMDEHGREAVYDSIAAFVETLCVPTDPK